MSSKLISIALVMCISVFSFCGGDNGGGGVTTYTVTFDSQGGSPVNQQTVEEGGYAIEPDNPVMEGFTFSGWFRETECANAWNFNTDTVVSDITLYAKWTADQVASPPDAPGMPALSPGFREINITWTAVAEADSYKVYYNISDESTGAILFNGDSDNTDTMCLLSGLSNGTVYYVWIKAVNEAGESDFSISANATPDIPVLLPKTGQTTSYYTGDDGELQLGVSWPSPRFIDNGNGTVTDNLTGLIWERSPNSDLKDWTQTLDFYSTFNLADFTDWRVPNWLELASLVNFNETDTITWLNTQGFLFNPSHYTLWASTSYPTSTNAWSVNLYDGTLINWDKTSIGIYHIAVRSGGTGSIFLPKTGQEASYYAEDDGDLKVGVSWPSPRFIDNEDGTITDKMTGLMWDIYGSSGLSWNQALNYCNNLDRAGHTDWRLPNVIELSSLIKAQEFTAAWLYPQGFSGIDGSMYWTSTTWANITSIAWVVHMGYGQPALYDKSLSGPYNGLHAMAVRSEE